MTDSSEKRQVSSNPNCIEQAIKALEPFADIGQWLFVRDLPDDTPMVEVQGINNHRWALTRGEFKAAHAALTPLRSAHETVTELEALRAENANLRANYMRLMGGAALETCATPERPFAWYRERVPVGYHIHVGDWPPPEPDDTAWQPLYLTPSGIPAKETGGRPVRPHRSGGQPVAPAFRDERLHRIDKLMDAQPGTPEGAELDKLVDEQVNAEKASERQPCSHGNATGHCQHCLDAL